MREPRPYQKHVSPADAIAGSKFFKDYRSAFEAATGLTLIVLNPDGTKSCIHSPHVNKKPAARTPAPRADVAQTVPVHYGNRVLALLALTPKQRSSNADSIESNCGSTVHGASAAAESAPVNGESPKASGATLAQHESTFRLLEFFALQLADWFVRHASSQTLRERPRLVRMMEWLEVHFHEPITLSEAAKALGLSPWTFSKTFLDLSGVNFRDALSLMRVDHAKRLLADPRIMNHQVAAAVGFRSVSQFNRVFKDLVGSTAGEFRRSLETQKESSPPRVGIPSRRPPNTAVVLRPSFTPLGTALSPSGHLAAATCVGRETPT